MNRPPNTFARFWPVLNLYRVSQNKRQAFERLLLPEHISNDILQYLIEWPNRSINRRIFLTEIGHSVQIL